MEKPGACGRSMQRPVAGKAVAMLLGICLGTTSAMAETVFPTPGGAPGSQTGDGSGVFVGVAGSPRTQLFTGTAATSIDIVVPPGRGRATPQVRLVYSSAGGPSPYGWGWNVPLARISRSTRNGVPRYDGSDSYVLETAEGTVELVPVAGTARYRAKVESGFLRIGFDRLTNSWTVIDKSGTKLVFGTTPAGRVGPAPRRPGGTYAWLIERSVDPFGNHIDYTYVDAMPGEPAPGLPLEISYGGNIRTGQLHVFAIRFAWATRPYPTVAPVSYRAGFAEVQDRILESIETVAQGSTVRRYSTNHEVDPVSGAVRLVGVSLDGFAADSRDDVALPSTVFRYAPAVQVGWPLGTSTERDAAATVFDSPGPFREVGRWVRFDTFDINGDAVADYVDAGGQTPTVRLGTGDGFGPAVPWAWPSYPRYVRKVDDSGHLVVNVFDITGDGLPDLVDGRRSKCGLGTWCVYRNTGAGFDLSATPWPAPGNDIRVVSTSGASVLADVADMNGDGRPDRVDATPYTSSSPYWHVYLNTGAGFAATPMPFAAPQRAISHSATTGSRSYLLSGLYDMNGDGLPDFVLADVDGLDRPVPLSTDRWEVYLNTGVGFADRPLLWSTERSGGLALDNFINEHSGGTEQTDTSIDLVDLTGDGLPDRVRYWSPGFLWDYGLDLPSCAANSCQADGTAIPPQCCYSLLVSVNTGTSFSDPVGWPAWHDYQLRSFSEYRAASAREFDLFDMDGDGLIDLVERESGQWRLFRHPASPFALASATPVAERARPNLLVEMLNGVGGETYIAYRPASSFPENLLPFPYWVVSYRELVDGIGLVPGGSFDYRYRGGHYDGNEREFRGFHTVLETDALGRTTATTFHQDDIRKGLVASSLVMGNPGCVAADPFDATDPCSPYGRILLESVNDWPTQEPILLISRTSTPYYRGQPVVDLSKTLAYEYDAYGNVVTEVVSSPSADTVETRTEYTYVLADRSDGIPDRYMVDRPARSVTLAASSAAPALAETIYQYGSSVSKTGALREVRACIAWTSSGCGRWSVTTYDYDAYGNVVRTRDPDGSTTTMAYDDLHLYASSTRNADGQVASITRDIRTGKPIRTIHVDGTFAATDYDGLGRSVRSWHDGFDREDPATAVRYTDGVLGKEPSAVRVDTYGAAPSVVFYDGMGRRLAAKTVVETDGGDRVVVDRLTLYGVAGQIVAEAVPFEARDRDIDILRATIADAPARIEYRYDADGRLAERWLPDGSRIVEDTSVPGVRLTVYPNLASGVFAGKSVVEFRDGFGRAWRTLTCGDASANPLLKNCNGVQLEARTVRYDGLDRPIELTTAADSTTPAVTTIQYDGLGNRTGLVDSDRGSWAYEYSDGGRVTRIEDPRGGIVTMKYDKLGRLRRQRAGRFRAAYAYQRRGAGIGKLRRVRSRSTGPSKVVKQFTYDDRARLVAETVRVRAGGATRRFTTYYGYDRLDRRQTVTYPTAVAGEDAIVTTEYSPYGRIIALTADGLGGRVEIVRDTAGDVYGNLTRIDFGNGLSDRFEYGAETTLGRLLCVRTTLAGAPGSACEGSPVDLARVHIADRDAAGNVLSIVDDLHVEGSSLDRSASFSYDALGRVTTADYGSDAPTTFVYDRRGNLTVVDGTAFLYSGAAPHQAILASGDPLMHDSAGNRTVKGEWSYAYDALGRLAEVRHAGAVRQLNYYDEGRTRVARYDATRGATRYYFGGLFEIEGDEIVRHYYAGGRLVASDRIKAPRGLALPGTAVGASHWRATGTPVSNGWVQESGSVDGERTREAALRVEDDVVGLLVVLLLLSCSVFLAPRRGKVALMTAIAFIVSTTPLPMVSWRLQGPWAWDPTPAAASTSGEEIVFYHRDRLGSPHMLSDGNGSVVEHRRYGAYGDLRAVLDAAGNSLSLPSTDVAFGGHQGDAASGLLYFGGRFYDPEIGQFLTPDPEAEFASPYLYGGGNPVNGVDGDGELFGVLIGSLLMSLLTAATASAFISGVAASFQGGDFLEAFRGGFVTGLIGAGLGTLAGTLNVAYQLAAGGSGFITVAEAASKVAEVGVRASFTTVVTHAAVTTGAAVGLGSDWQTALGIVTALGASYAYDNLIIKDSGTTAESSSGSVRDVVKADSGSSVQSVNTTVGHTNVTQEAAVGTGWEQYDHALVDANVAQDGTGSTLGTRIRALAGNDEHFGRLPRTVSSIRESVGQALDGSLKQYGTSAGQFADAAGSYTMAVGRAAHLIQDHLTLGHMVPGTRLFAGPLGAPIRLVIHQVFGGEIAFRQAQLNATRNLLIRFGPMIQA